MEQPKEVQEKLAVKKPLYDYDDICDFFDDYEEKRSAGKQAKCVKETDRKYLIRYAFDAKKKNKMNKNFIQFILREYLPDYTEGINKEIDIFKEFGLKLHICLPEDDPQMFRLGWQIVVDILAQHNAANFKFIRRGKLMSSEEGQEGKDITVYIDADNRNVKDTEAKRGWEFIINQINNALFCANISPGKQPPGTLEKPEKYIANCAYISYRYENGNPSYDPLEGIVIKEDDAVFKRKQEIIWEESAVNLADLLNNNNNPENIFRRCCK